MHRAKSGAVPESQHRVSQPYRAQAWAAPAQWHFIASLHMWYQHRWHGTACATLHPPKLPQGSSTPALPQVLENSSWGAGKDFSPSPPLQPGLAAACRFWTWHSSGMKGLCGCFQPINQGSKQPCWRPGCGLRLNDQRERSAAAKRKLSYLFTERNTVYTVYTVFRNTERQLPTSTNPFSSGEAIHLAWGRQLSAEIVALSDGNCASYSQGLLLVGALSPAVPPGCTQWVRDDLTTGFTAWLCFPPGSSSALLSWWRAARALGLSLFIAEGSWDATVLLIYTLGERWLIFWETSHMAESPFRVTLLTLAIKRTLESLSKGNHMRKPWDDHMWKCSPGGKKPSKKGTLY